MAGVWREIRREPLWDCAGLAFKCFGASTSLFDLLPPASLRAVGREIAGVFLKRGLQPLRCLRVWIFSFFFALPWLGDADESLSTAQFIIRLQWTLVDSCFCCLDFKSWRNKMCAHVFSYVCRLDIKSTLLYLRWQLLIISQSSFVLPAKTSIFLFFWLLDSQKNLKKSFHHAFSLHYWANKKHIILWEGSGERWGWRGGPLWKLLLYSTLISLAPKAQWSPGENIRARAVPLRFLSFKWKLFLIAEQLCKHGHHWNQLVDYGINISKYISDKKKKKKVDHK